MKEHTYSNGSRSWSKHYDEAVGGESIKLADGSYKAGKPDRWWRTRLIIGARVGDKSIHFELKRFKKDNASEWLAHDDGKAMLFSVTSKEALEIADVIRAAV